MLLLGSSVAAAPAAPAARESGAAAAALLLRVAARLAAAPAVEVTESLSTATRQLTGPTAFASSGSGLLAAESLGAVPGTVTAGRTVAGLTPIRFIRAPGRATVRLWVDAALLPRREVVTRGALVARRTFAYPAVAAPPGGPVAPASVPTGPFVAAAEAGDLAVGLAAQPAGTGRLRLTATVIGPDGDGATAVLVDTTLSSRRSASAPTALCGPGCFRATLALDGAPREALVRIRRLGHLPLRVRFAFPTAWPPLEGAGIARTATRTFAALSSVTFRETLRSNPATAVRTRWVFEAPDRLSYATDGGPQGVISGSRRWDRLPGTAWVESPQDPIQQPEAPWGAASPRRATLLGQGVFRGHRVRRIAFVDPQVPAWYTATVAIDSGRTLALQMVAPAHFMSHVYRDFDAAPQIVPPVP